MPKKIDGKNQSPIDIRYTECNFDENLSEESLQFNYTPGECRELLNNGYNWSSFNDSARSASTFTAAHLPATYKFAQFHAHWGSNSWNGSEHQVLGRGYAAEIHFVHYKEQYGSVENAVKHKDGLAVVGVFLEESAHMVDNVALDPIVSACKTLFRQKAGSRVPIVQNYDLTALFPERKSFWTYEGSLTTMPFTECVLWTVLREPIPISFQQLKTMRVLRDDNVRPVQNSLGRLVRASFELGGRIV